jgi:hypothetical protein
VYGFFYALVLATVVAWYFGAPAFVFGLVVVWCLWAVVATYALLGEDAPSDTPNPTSPVLEKPVVERDSGVGERTAPLGSHELRALPYKEYLQTPHWKHLRQDKVRAAGHRCQLCNRGSVTFNVHHRTYDRLGEELDEDLTVLCSDCHNKFHENGRLVR